MITRFTITGADNSIKPEELIPITEKFPFVEWGILASKSQMGGRRFPSMKWIQTLQEIKPKEMNLSLHLCGRWVRDLLQSDFSFIEQLGETWKIFNRVQINTHAEFHWYVEEAIEKLSHFQDKEFIFQYDNVNTELIDVAKKTKVNFSALFDLSHGIGILPDKCPDLLTNVKCGYAGGLSPINLKDQIIKIEQKARDTEIWIDMETHVRSNNDQLFDLSKVIQCLEIAKETCPSLSMTGVEE